MSSLGVSVAFRPSVLWLLGELTLATAICSLPIIWNGSLTDRSLTNGLLLAGLVVVPSEILRHFGVPPIRRSRAQPHVKIVIPQALVELRDYADALVKMAKDFEKTHQELSRRIEAIRTRIPEPQGQRRLDDHMRTLRNLPAVPEQRSKVLKNLLEELDHLLTEIRAVSELAGEPEGVALERVRLLELSGLAAFQVGRPELASQYLDEALDEIAVLEQRT